MSYGTSIAALQVRQAIWLRKRGWWRNKTPLESLMLVVSECGEAANEVRGTEPTSEFASELADIVLRTMGIAAEHGINLENAVLMKMLHNETTEPKKDRIK